MMYVQLSGGNNYYLSPQTPIDAFAPTGEMNFLYSSGYDKTSASNSFLLIGLKYNYSYQKYKSANTYYNASCNEVVFSVGGAKEWKLENNHILMPISVNLGSNYARTTEPHVNLALPALVSGYKSDDIHEFLQFYVSAGLFYVYKFSQRISVLAGAKAYLFLFENDITDLGMKASNISINYAPFKLSPSIGLQFSFK